MRTHTLLPVLAALALATIARAVAADAPPTRPEGSEPRDLVVVTSVLDFSTEGLPREAKLSGAVAFYVIIPKRGVIRGQMETQLLDGRKRAVFQESFLYDAGTFGSKHLVFIDPAQLPGVGDYTVAIRVSGLRTDETGATREFDHEKSYPLSLVEGDGGEESGPERERLAFAVLFDYDSARVAPRELDKVRRAAKRFATWGPHALLVVEGHTDTAGSAAYNLDLSMRRARAVKRALVGAGAPAARIRTHGYGFDRLADRGRGGGAAARNRRTEFVLLRSK